MLIKKAALARNKARLISEVAVMPRQWESETIKLGINKHIDKRKISTVRIDNEADVSSVNPLSVRILHFP